jgi:glucose-1-phosphate adenylyltransferase
VIGVRSRIGRGVHIRQSLVLGADEYQTALEGERSRGDDRPPLGIGENTRIENAIIDKNTRIGRNVSIRNQRGLVDHDGGSYFVRDGIVIVPKGATILDGTEI